jgi:hypothetical protein
MLAATEFFAMAMSAPLGVRDRAYHDRREHSGERDKAEWYSRRGHDRPRDKGHNPRQREHDISQPWNPRAILSRTRNAIGTPSTTRS